MQVKPLILLLLCVALLIPAQAATFTVTKLVDTNDGTCNTDCSLREAITAANTATGEDIISFANVSGVLQLNSALPNLISNVNIQGPGANLLTVRAGGVAGGYRVFMIGDGASIGAAVTISGLTISNGNAPGPMTQSGQGLGGGVLITHGVLTLAQCFFIDNSAEQGGGVATNFNAAATLTVSDCTFYNNTAFNVGGGLYSNNSTTTITNCTFSGNQAKVHGGALRNINGTMSVRHCTIANNRADSDGIDNGNGQGVGGGIADTGPTLILSHTLFANNYRGTDNSYRDNITTQNSNILPNSEGYNLCDDDGGGFLTGHGGNFFTGPGDLINTNANLGALQNNGGPTPTHALPYDSPAVNAGNPDFAAPPSFDQRGSSFPRVNDGRIDIGAFEAANPSNFQISINDATVTEGNSGTTALTFTATLSEASPVAVTVNYSTQDLSATAPADYAAASGTITFAAGETQKTISIFGRGDTLDEADETFRLTLLNPTNAVLNDAQGLGTITDDDPAPTVTINDVSVFEGNSGTINATFTIDLSARSGKTVSLNAIPTNGTARAPGDYTSGGVNLVFAPGETRKSFTVPVKGDLLNEADEVFYVILSSPVNCAISRGRGIATIFDDDAKPTLSIDDVSIGEGNSGQRVASFRLNLSAPSGQVVKVNYATVAGTATANTDYVQVASTQIAFNTGSSFVYARVLINGDLLHEPGETFKVNLSSAVNASIADAQAIGTILNDDSAPALLIDDVQTTEGDSGTKTLTFTVTLSKASGQTVSVNYATADGAAKAGTTAGSDYVAQSGTLSFAAGQTSKAVSVVINGDTVAESDETLFVFLSSAVNASIGKARGIGTITNDDASG